MTTRAQFLSLTSIRHYRTRPGILLNLLQQSRRFGSIGGSSASGKTSHRMHRHIGMQSTTMRRRRFFPFIPPIGLLCTRSSSALRQGSPENPSSLSHSLICTRRRITKPFQMQVMVMPALTHLRQTMLSVNLMAALSTTRDLLV